MGEVAGVGHEAGRIDETGEPERRAKATAEAIRYEADGSDDDSRREALRKHASRSQSAGKLKAMLQVAETEREVVIRPEQLDRDPHVLNCKNGTLDLMTGELRPHKREDLLTMLAPVEFSPTATCPTFERFLDRITNRDKELANFLQRVAGYSLTGESKEKIFFVLRGEGDNGKTTFLEAIRYVLGEYAGQVPIDSLLKRKENSIPNDIAQLRGKRFVTSSEPPAGRAFNDSLMKYLTGTGTLQARLLYKEFFDFTPNFKLFIDANRKPKVAGDDKAMWNRIRLIPFDAVITDAEKDKDLIDKLKAEASGILAWMVRGCLAWQKEGLRPPECVTLRVIRRKRRHPRLGGLGSVAHPARRVSDSD
jgi:putative DNA primase/helicase